MIKKYPLISIVVPIYNVAKYLDRCLLSISKQTYKNIEIILVDDGSTDSSNIICNKYLRMDNRFRYFYKKNEGLSSARNYGVKKAIGEYTCFVDSDDYISKHYVMILYSFMNRHKLDLSICGLNLYDGKTTIHSSNLKNIKFIIFDKYTFWENYYLGKPKNSPTLSLLVVPTKMYITDKIKNISFKNTLGEDEYFIHNVIEKSCKIGYINQFLYFYDISRNDSIIHKWDPYKRALIKIDSLENRKEFFIKNIYPKKIIKSLNKMLQLAYYEKLFYENCKFRKTKLFFKGIMILLNQFSFKNLKMFFKINFKHFYNILRKFKYVLHNNL